MQLNRIILYVRDIEKSVQFYETYFGFRASQRPGDRITELLNPEGGAILMLHPASKGLKRGQASVKLVFDVRDVRAFCAQCAEKGLDFGPVHEAEGYQFANVKDPDQNSLSVSGRAFQTRD